MVTKFVEQDITTVILCVASVVAILVFLAVALRLRRTVWRQSSPSSLLEDDYCGQIDSDQCPRHGSGSSSSNSSSLSRKLSIPMKCFAASTRPVVQ